MCYGVGLSGPRWPLDQPRADALKQVNSTGGGRASLGRRQCSLAEGKGDLGGCFGDALALRCHGRVVGHRDTPGTFLLLRVVDKCAAACDQRGRLWTSVAPSVGDQQRQLGGSRRQRVSPRACSLAACARELTVIGTALTPRVHAVQVDSCVLAGAVAPQLLETATMSLRLSCLLIEVSALLRRCLLCFAAHPVRHARRRWRRFDLTRPLWGRGGVSDPVRVGLEHLHGATDV